jgi:YbbR domain-containing protein
VRDLFTRNLGWKLFSLLAASLLWLTFARDPQLAMFVTAPVEYKGIPNDLEISSDVVDSVSLEIRGPSEKLKSFAPANSPVILDFSRVQRAGQQTFQVDEHDVALPAGVSLVRAIPSQLRFSFEHRIFREVPVQVRFSGQPQPGYHVADSEVRPPTQTIVGPDSRVQRIQYAVTDPIDISTVVGISEFHVNTFVGDPHVRFQASPRVSVKVRVEKNS